jgi:hypothetical protein
MHKEQHQMAMNVEEFKVNTKTGNRYKKRDGKWVFVGKEPQKPSTGKVVEEVARGAGKLAMQKPAQAINAAVDAVAHGPIDALAKAGRAFESGLDGTVEHIKKNPIKRTTR